MGAICQSTNPISPLTKCNFSQYLMMLYVICKKTTPPPRYTSLKTWTEDDECWAVGITNSSHEFSAQVS